MAPLFHVEHPQRLTKSDTPIPEKSGGEQDVASLAFKIDPRIKAIVDTWPVRFETPRAIAMGFSADPELATVIRDHIREQGIAV